jgi:hypothetical protein
VDTTIIKERSSKALLYIARDNSGYIIYDTFTGETIFFATQEELEQYKASNHKDFFTACSQ